jgi:hypothetical protein
LFSRKRLRKAEDICKEYEKTIESCSKKTKENVAQEKIEVQKKADFLDQNEQYKEKVKIAMIS